MKTETRAGLLIVIILLFLVCLSSHIKTEKYNEMESFYKGELTKKDSLLNAYRIREAEDTAYYQVFERMFNEVKNK